MQRVKCDEIFEMGDQDGDGRIGYNDMTWLMNVTAPDETMTAKMFDAGCQMVGATDNVMNKNQLFKLFQDDAGFFQEGWDKLKASNVRP